MFSKKFALLMLTTFVLLGFSTKPVSAAANDDTANVQADQVTDTTQTITSNDSQSTQGTQNTQVIQTTVTLVNNNSDTSIKTSETVKKTTTTGSTTKKSTKKKKAKYTKAQLRLMASIINCEAGGESLQGKLAVGVVIMNRVKSKSFPNTIKKVIYQKGQFSPVRNGSLRKKLKQYDAGKTNSKQWKSCILAAKKVLNGQKTIVVKGKVKNLSGFHFFSVRLSGARLKLGGHRFK